MGDVLEENVLFRLMYIVNDSYRKRSIFLSTCDWPNTSSFRKNSPQEEQNEEYINTTRPFIGNPPKPNPKLRSLLAASAEF